MEQGFYMGFVTSPIHFGRVILLYAWSSPFSKYVMRHVPWMVFPSLVFSPTLRC